MKRDSNFKENRNKVLEMYTNPNPDQFRQEFSFAAAEIKNNKLINDHHLRLGSLALKTEDIRTGRAWHRSNNYCDEILTQNYKYFQRLSAHIARSLFGSNSMTDSHIIVCDAVFEAIKNLKNFELDRESLVMTYVVPRIKGSLIDSLRASSKHRTMRDRQREYYAYESDGFSRQEIFEIMGYTEELFRKDEALVDSTINERLYRPNTTEGEEGEEMGIDYNKRIMINSAEHDALQPYFENENLVFALKNTFKQIPARDRDTFIRFYVHREALVDIARDYGVDKSRLCQINKKILARILYLMEIS